MGPGLLWRVSLALACLLQVQEAVGGRSSPPERSEARPVSQWLLLNPFMSIKSILLGRYQMADQLPQAYRNSDTSNDRTSSKSNKHLRVRLPPLPCREQLDCLQYSAPQLVCRAGQCSCRSPYCWTYHYEAVSIWTAKYIFECDTCGVLGSWCNDSLTCDSPGECWSDGYCHCIRGENYNNVCVTTNTNWILKMALIGMGIMMLFALSLFLWSCYKDPPCGRPESWCFGLFNRNQAAESGGQSPSSEYPAAVIRSQHNGSSDKTPAYTIQAHYTRQVPCGSTHSDQDPEVRADEYVGGATGGHASPPGPTVCGGTADGEDNSSFSSVITSVTDVSNTSTLPADDAATSGPATRVPLDATARRYQVFTINVDTPSETTNYQTPSEDSDGEDSSSAGSVGSCSHVRCELCLPRSPETFAPDRTVTASPAPGNRPQLPHLQARDTVNTETVMESTTL